MTKSIAAINSGIGFYVDKRFEDMATGEVKYNVVIGKNKLKLHLSEINTKNTIVKLAKYGLVISQEEAQAALNELINQINFNDLEYIYTTSRIGKVGSKLVHPFDKNIIFDCKEPREEEYIKNFQTNGTFEGWKSEVFDSYEGNAQAQFYIIASFASIMLDYLQVKPFVLEIFGLTTSGKSTIIKASATIWGNKELVGYWNSTVNAMERRASYAGMYPLFVDDTQNADEINMKKMIYNFSLGRGRDRATGTGLQEVRTWSNILLSSGEYSVFNLVKNTGGAAARCISLNLKSNDYSLEFYEKIYDGMEYNYGQPGYEFFKYWRNTIQNEENNLKEDYEIIVKKLNKSASNSVTQRLARSYAVVILAAEILKSEFDFRIDTESFYLLFEELDRENQATDLPLSQLKNLLELVDTERFFGKSYYLSKEGDLLLPVKYLNDFLGNNNNVIREAWLDRGFSEGYQDKSTGKLIDYKKRHTIDKFNGVSHKRNTVAISKSVINKLGYDFGGL